MTGKRVQTCFGPGTALKREGDEGILSHRYVVKLDKCPPNLMYIQEAQGGLCFLDTELKEIKD